MYKCIPAHVYVYVISLGPRRAQSPQGPTKAQGRARGAGPDPRRAPPGPRKGPGGGPRAQGPG